MGESEKATFAAPSIWSRLSNVIGVVSAAVTVYLTIHTTYLKEQVDATNLTLNLQQQQLDEKLRTRATDLEEAKERTSRYNFVHELFPDLTSQDAQRREMSANLIHLALNDDEATKFFTAFATSSNAELRMASATGLHQIAQEHVVIGSASGFEKRGFDLLVAGKYDDAEHAFAQADSAYPTYHNTYEIQKLLRSHRSELRDPEASKSVLNTIVSKYAYGAPSEQLQALRARTK